MEILNEKVIVQKLPKKKTSSKLDYVDETEEISYDCVVAAISKEAALAIPQLKLGDTVLITKFAGDKVMILDREYISVNYKQLIAIL